MLDRFRPLALIAKELKRIAFCLEYFAAADAREHGRMFTPRRKGWAIEPDASELLGTDSEWIEKRKQELFELAMQKGYKLVEIAEEQPSEEEEWKKDHNYLP